MKQIMEYYLAPQLYT